MTTTPGLIWLFLGEPARAEQIANHHRALNEALERLDSARGKEAGQAVIERLTSEVVAASTGFAAAAGPLITHLLVITAALRDAAHYRRLNGECCAQDPGHLGTDVPCDFHAVQRNLADVYTTALHAITG
ncbi:hypothetical protein [Actinoallomurus rhizosphaericola]|uniref:hypothetical protein n=1 Tax=Actinoallomurus rhizosphaericola TaxID=2952536 RepID=UPI00209237BF|nr:hypothetical protein [Actinoallomurus rhizosphaericola]MCO5999763.1 hypothetical protein [Actinoallomurus rhizosphaericola]